LLARRLGDTGLSIVGSPDYLARHGVPRSLQELRSHNRLGSSYRRNVPDWPLRVDGEVVGVPVAGSVRAADGETLRQLAVRGLGLARLSHYHVGQDMKKGVLVPVMEDFNPREREPIHAVYLGKAGRLPARVRVLMDFLAAHITQAALDEGISPIDVSL
jgi:DNA-binding transcriptional LysR family regulator